MAEIYGRYAKVAIYDGSTETALSPQPQEMTPTDTRPEIDVTAFQDASNQYLVGLRDVGYSFTGRYDPTDTTGWALLHNLYAADGDGRLTGANGCNDSSAEMRFYISPTHYLACDVVITEYTITPNRAELVDASVTVKASGPITDNLCTT